MILWAGGPASPSPFSTTTNHPNPPTTNHHHYHHMNKRISKPADHLIGQKLAYMGDHDHRRNHVGYRCGIIRAVTRDRSGRIKRLLVQDQPLRGAAKPRARVRLWPNEWTHDAMCGIERYKRIKPVAVVDAMLREKREKREKREGVQA